MINYVIGNAYGSKHVILEEFMIKTIQQACYYSSDSASFLGSAKTFGGFVFGALKKCVQP